MVDGAAVAGHRVEVGDHAADLLHQRVVRPALGNEPIEHPIGGEPVHPDCHLDGAAAPLDLLGP